MVGTAVQLVTSNASISRNACSASNFGMITTLPPARRQNSAEFGPAPWCIGMQSRKRERPDSGTTLAMWSRYSWTFGRCASRAGSRATPLGRPVVPEV